MGQLRVWGKPGRELYAMMHIALQDSLSTQNNYRITAFTNGNADINGLNLQLGHSQDPTLRPLDELFTDHFMQGLFKQMKGAGESEWVYVDYEYTFGKDSNLLNLKIWETGIGKGLFELAHADRLFDHRILQQELST